MPEGDTIHKIACAIAPHLEGQHLVRFEMRDDRSLELIGHRVATVQAIGKHLTVEMEGEFMLRTHLGMHGSWHRYATGESWKRPARQASLVLGTTRDVFVCFNAKAVEYIRKYGSRWQSSLGRLGPDLTAHDDPDDSLLIKRARHLVQDENPIIDALLHQGIACGIGNVYKSEVLFLNGIHPLRRMDSLEDADLAELFRMARRLLQANLHGGARVTRQEATTLGEGRGGAPRLWVYGRLKEGCFSCSSTIEGELLGSRRRITYWCPSCQN